MFEEIFPKVNGFGQFVNLRFEELRGPRRVGRGE